MCSHFKAHSPGGSSNLLAETEVICRAGTFSGCDVFLVWTWGVCPPHATMAQNPQFLISTRLFSPITMQASARSNPETIQYLLPLDVHVPESQDGIIAWWYQLLGALCIDYWLDFVTADWTDRRHRVQQTVHHKPLHHRRYIYIYIYISFCVCNAVGGSSQRVQEKKEQKLEHLVADYSGSLPSCS